MKLFSRTFRLNFSLRISNKMKMEYVSFVSVLLLSVIVFADDAVKNHRAEKRQDNSYLFFGGWRPVKSGGNQFYHASATGRYHDLISALPGSLDSTSKLYTHALPSNYYKDIYSYYPRPAIRATPKKNTPTYMERFKPKRQQPKHGGRNNGGSPQYIDIQKLELKHLRDLQNVLLQAKELPLTQLNLPSGGGGGGRKPYEIVELAVQPFQQNTHNTRPRNHNRYNRNRGAQGNNKGHRRIPQNATPNQLPLQYQYISVPKVNSLMPQILPKQLSVSPVKLPQPVPAVEDILGIKNIQVVEVPVPAALPINLSTGKVSGGSQYGKRNNGYSQQYRVSTPKSPQKVNFHANTYYAHQAEQPRKHYPAPTPSKSNYGMQQAPQIEAELIKLSEHEVQELLKNLQMVSKNSQDFLKILPLAETAHKNKQEQIHLVLAVPDENIEQNGGTSAYESQNHGEGSSYGSNDQYAAVHQQVSYPSPADASISYNSGGYQVNSQNQAAEHNAAGYQIDTHAGNGYEQYIDGKAGYGQESYDVRPANEEQRYSQAGYSQPVQQQGSQGHREQYLEVVSPPADASGYRREPVLAVEIQKGQSIEEAIKAIDPETLQRLGAHGKDGLEIEVVEVPVDEYSAESKKAETYVSSSNSTTLSPAKKTTTVTPLVKEKSTTPEKKS